MADDDACFLARVNGSEGVRGSRVECGATVACPECHLNRRGRASGGVQPVRDNCASVQFARRRTHGDSRVPRFKCS